MGWVGLGPNFSSRQARRRNKPSALEWRIVYIHEQVCITCDGWNIGFFDFVTDSQRSSLRVNLPRQSLRCSIYGS